MLLGRQPTVLSFQTSFYKCRSTDVKLMLQFFGGHSREGSETGGEKRCQVAIQPTVSVASCRFRPRPVASARVANRLAEPGVRPSWPKRDPSDLRRRARWGKMNSALAGQAS